MDTQLLQLLQKSGFTDKEARVYLAMLELGKARVNDIAKKTELKRPIIYVLLEGLMQRGYASEVPNKKINTYSATDPSVILSNLQITTKNFSEMLPIFRTLKNKGKNRPRITYHETKEGILKVYDEISSSPEAFFISNYQRINKHFPGTVENWIREMKRGISPVKGKHLISSNKQEIKYGKEFQEAGQNVRVAKEFRDTNMDFTIFKNKLAITSLEEKPFIVVIESEEIVKSMQPIFEIAWSKGKDIEKIKS